MNAYLTAWRCCVSPPFGAGPIYFKKIARNAGKKIEK
jgi:hypothetical protein